MTKSKITVINTGGTFNKRYNPITGELEVPKDDLALQDIIKYSYNIEFELINIISKDSLEMNDFDRELILKTIEKCTNENIIIVHGTDTMDLTAKYLDEKIKNRNIVLTGAMLPISINKVEATLNFASAIGFLNSDIKNDIYISMHASVKNYKKLIKNRELGKFLNI
ncbi:asparaginase domain-containing protein [Arcobacter porcinus]|uniref:Asparaginase n=1 Tax=Arcobacter porcinus TaxID=1935204 RepID=A0A1C0AZC8_9BACT|nr:asparaginase domain-containing protein [Arcobacter porcinus]OCL96604.1 putative L-asparaginase periplasmic precursor [Aliarcobacter thereius]OCL83644.1 putative L-asparaginase periplasmic precursor [Arcobacter porcinus]OCL83863.1 putative L-asparaginase periplasmic precursor [Arcobacter porcinus]OCL85869.1 putative L-asparaginase periplasmic precursor [Arcobacter porcinus]OCL92856.1 putative L-asparaginase periplasmic precursor [Arcobacter porcinus]